MIQQPSNKLRDDHAILIKVGDIRETLNAMSNTPIADSMENSALMKLAEENERLHALYHQAVEDLQAHPLSEILTDNKALRQDNERLRAELAETERRRAEGARMVVAQFQELQRVKAELAIAQDNYQQCQIALQEERDTPASFYVAEATRQLREQDVELKTLRAELAAHIAWERDAYFSIEARSIGHPDELQWKKLRETAPEVVRQPASSEEPAQ